MSTAPKSVLALDVGGRRVGIAIASLDARLARPLTTLTRGDKFFVALETIIADENVTALVVGLPHGLGGQATPQTAETEAFAGELRGRVPLPLHFQDEAVTSKNAVAELEAAGKPYEKSDIDALAATYILEDWLIEHEEPVS